MNSFSDEIKSTLHKISAKLDAHRAEVWASWGPHMFGSRINAPHELTAEEVAFLVLLEDKYTNELGEKIFPLVKESLDEWYQGSGQTYRQIRLLCIDIRKLSENKWELVYEDDNIDVVVHTFFSGWEVDYLARTH